MDYSVKRIFRRVVIALVYVLIIGGIGLVIYSLRTPAAPTCFDTIRNQNETGVDCGGNCKSCELIKNLTVFEAKVFPTKEGFADVFAEVRNTNLDYGVPQLGYTFQIFDRENQIVGEKAGVAYILPNATKFIIEQAIPVKRTPVRVEFYQLPANFQEIKDYVKPRLSVLGANNKVVSGAQGGVLAVEGTAFNQTNFGLDKVVIAVRLKNELGETVAVNRHEIRTLEAGERRFFQVTWVYRVPHFTLIDPIIDTNVFEESNYLKFINQQRTLP